MPKHPRDETIARIEADIIKAIQNEIGDDELPVSIKEMFGAMKYLLEMSDEPAADPKPRRTRRKRTGLPAEEQA